MFLVQEFFCFRLVKSWDIKILHPSRFNLYWNFKEGAFFHDTNGFNRIYSHPNIIIWTKLLLFNMAIIYGYDFSITNSNYLEKRVIALWERIKLKIK